MQVELNTLQITSKSEVRTFSHVKVKMSNVEGDLFQVVRHGLRHQQRQLQETLFSTFVYALLSSTLYMLSCILLRQHQIW